MKKTAAQNKIAVTSDTIESSEQQTYRPHPTLFSVGQSAGGGKKQPHLSKAPLIESELNSPLSVHAESIL